MSTNWEWLWVAGAFTKGSSGGSLWKMTVGPRSEWWEECQPCKDLGKEHSGHGNGECRGPEEGTGVAFQGTERRLMQRDPDERGEGGRREVWRRSQGSGHGSCRASTLQPVASVLRRPWAAQTQVGWKVRAQVHSRGSSGMPSVQLASSSPGVIKAWLLSHCPQHPSAGDSRFLALLWVCDGCFLERYPWMFILPSISEPSRLFTPHLLVTETTCSFPNTVNSYATYSWNTCLSPSFCLKFPPLLSSLENVHFIHRSSSNALFSGKSLNGPCLFLRSRTNSFLLYYSAGAVVSLPRRWASWGQKPRLQGLSQSQHAENDQWLHRWTVRAHGGQGSACHGGEGGLPGAIRNALSIKNWRTIKTTSSKPSSYPAFLDTVDDNILLPFAKNFSPPQSHLIVAGRGAAGSCVLFVCFSLFGQSTTFSHPLSFSFLENYIPTLRRLS